MNWLLTMARLSGVTVVIEGSMVAERTKTNRRTRRSLRNLREKPGAPTGFSK